MIGRWLVIGLIGLLVACSDRERPPADAAEWAEVEALANDARSTPAASDDGGAVELARGNASAKEFEPYMQKLAEMKSVKRAAGETLMTGEALVLDHDAGFVRMDHDVVVEDDQGVLKTESLVGRFSTEDKLELKRVEAKGDVAVVSGERTLRADAAFYNRQEGVLVLTGAVRATESTNSLSADAARVWVSEKNELLRISAEGSVVARYEDLHATGEAGLYDAKKAYARLEGRAMVESGENRVTAERLEIWTTEGERALIGEPNVVAIGNASAFELEGVPATTNELTEIRGNRLVYSEKKGTIDLVGAVRVRDPRAAMNCDEIRLNLKDESEIDWIEAVGEVIIQIGGIKGLPPNVKVVRAVAGRATYRMDENKFALEKEPKVKVGLNVMTGESIYFWVNPWRMLCEPNARLVLRLDAETKEKFLKDLNE